MKSWKYFDPVFEYKTLLDDSILPWRGHINFAYDLVANLKPKRIAELGTYKGTSLFSMAQSIKDNGLEAEVFAIDCWEGDEHAGFYDNSIYDSVVKISRDFYLKSNIRLIKKYFDDALVEFKDNSLDLLHIDGLHTYEAVKHDFDTWFPKLKKDGIVMFHDTKVPDFGVWKVWEEIKDSNKNAFYFDFSHSFGLGIMFLDIDESIKEVLKSEIFIKYYETKAQLNDQINTLKAERLKSSDLDILLKNSRIHIAHLEKVITRYEKEMQSLPHKIIRKLSGK